MSRIISHYSPREWKIMEQRKAHDAAGLPNRTWVPAPNSGAWPYQQRDHATEALPKSRQHQRYLHNLAETERALKKRKEIEEEAKKRESAQEKQLRDRTTQLVASTTAAKLAESPRRRPQVAVTVQPGVRPPAKSSTPRYLAQYRAEHARKEREAKRRKEEAERRSQYPKGMTPIAPDVKDCMVEILQTRKAELEAALETFPLASSVSLDRRKGIIQRELQQLQTELRKYQYPVVFKKFRDPHVVA